MPTRADTLKLSFLDEAQRFPAVFEPTDAGAAIAQLRDERQALVETIQRHGALLLRGFPFEGPEAIALLAQLMGDRLADYTIGNTRRTSLGNGIYTSTEYPASLEIVMHNEQAYAAEWPSRLYFYSDVVAPHGGETPLADGRRILDRLSSASLEQLRSRRILYVRNLRSSAVPGSGRSWQENFSTDDRARVEALCRGSDTRFAWQVDGGIRLFTEQPAIHHHPVTEEQVCFNQILLFHSSNHPVTFARRAAVLRDDPQGAPFYCCFDNGMPIGDELVRELRAATEAASVARPWQERDLLVIDNMLVAHGRRPYRPPRRLLLGMA